MKHTPFLKQIAHHFLEKHEADLYRYTFYFQNRRAGLFFLHYIEEEAKQRGKTIFLPEVTTLVEYLYKTVGAEQPDPNNDLFVLYEMYSVIREEIAKEEPSGSKRWDRFKLERFSDFYQLGSYILNDFNDIDKQLADPDKIFQNAHELLKIEHDFRPRFTEDEQRVVRQLLGREYYQEDEKYGGEMSYVKTFVSLFSLLSELYTKTKRRLRQKGLFYTGMLMRDALEESKYEAPFDLSQDKEKTHVFVGLNALSKAEKKLLDLYRDNAKTLFYWDYNGPILGERGDDGLKEVGRVIRENLQAYPMPKDCDKIDFEPITDLPEVEIVGIPSKVGQTLFMTHNRILPCLSTPKFQQAISNLEVAVVLPNERLLLPLLSNLPKEISSVNVTMGYPIKDTPIGGMCLKLLSLIRLLTSRSNAGRNKGAFWLTKEVMEVLSLNALDPLFPDKEILRTLSTYFEKERLFQLDERDLEKVLNYLTGRAGIDTSAVEYIRQIISFPPEESQGSYHGYWVMEYFLKLITLLSDVDQRGKESIPTDREVEISGAEDAEVPIKGIDTVYAFLRHLIQERTEALFQSEKGVMELDIRLSVDLLKGLINYAHIPYEGEPLKGLQVLGILETRTLDFDTLFIPDATEGILPAHTRLNTLIPHPIREGLGLPTYKWQELTRAYNFFRLITRASKVYASFDARKNENSDGEPSRYLRLMQYIFAPKADGQGLITEGTASYPVLAKGKEQPDLRIDSEAVAIYRQNLLSDKPDPKLITSLGIKVEDLPHFSNTRYRSLSATAINDFLTCPKRFYFKHVEGRQEEQPITGLLEEKDKGTLLHETLRELYEPYIGQRLKQIPLPQWLEDNDHTLSEKVEALFGKHFGNMSKSGFNGKELKVVQSHVERVIKYDSHFLKEWIYLGGEVHFSGKVISQNDVVGNNGVNVSGDIDRLLYNPKTRQLLVIDFKTGNDKGETSTTSIENGSFDHVVTQLSLYSLIVGAFLSDDKKYGTYQIPMLNGLIPPEYVRIVPTMFKPLDGKPKAIQYGKNDVVTDFMGHHFSKPKDHTTPNLAEWFAETVLLTPIREILAPEQTFATKPCEKICKNCLAREICPDSLYRPY